MSQKYEKLKALLRELFQLDQPDLDFGLYRIMHAKSAEITQFLDEDLLPQVKDALAHYKTADKAEIETELAKVVAGIEAAGMDPEQSPKVVELRARLAHEAVDIGALESEVYDHLFGFFRRYYSDGDFLSKRVYKPGVYAIPYEGEEVKLHWANADQYYIKTSEYLRDYAFRLQPDAEENPMRVHFRLVDAAEGEHGNVKAAQGKDRRFRLAEDEPVTLEDGELVVRFTYQPDPAKQKDLNAAAEASLMEVADPALAQWIRKLGVKHRRVDGSESENNRLRVHLDRYTARNTFDYFIHKDLGGFLRRELDFYIKNEVMHLDDIENESVARVEQYLSKIKIIRRIAGKIIQFLAQLEDYQKKLWLKKKFVVETEYCMTLDRIPEELYEDIAVNEAQREEWVKLFAIDEIHSPKEQSQPALLVQPPPAYSTPLTVEFLRANQELPLDTRFFDSTFRHRLLEQVENLDQSIDGVLVHSDNFQALRLLQSRYKDRVKCVYIDPPYNTASSAIPYKNDYKHSSFAAMMNDRVDGLWRMLTKDGAIFVSIDKAERTVVEHIMDGIFGTDNRVEELIWAMNTNNSQAPNYSTNHEYVLVYAKDRVTAEQDRSMFREPKPGYEEVMELVARLNPGYPTIATIEGGLRKLYKQHKIALREDLESPHLIHGFAPRMKLACS